MPTTTVSVDRVRQQLADHVIRAKAARHIKDTLEIELQHDAINQLLDQLTNPR